MAHDMVGYCIDCCQQKCMPQCCSAVLDSIWHISALRMAMLLLLLFLTITQIRLAVPRCNICNVAIAVIMCSLFLIPIITVRIQFVKQISDWKNNVTNWRCLAYLLLFSFSLFVSIISFRSLNISLSVTVTAANLQPWPTYNALSSGIVKCGAKFELNRICGSGSNLDYKIWPENTNFRVMTFCMYIWMYVCRLYILSAVGQLN